MSQLKRGRFSKQEDDYIRNNVATMNDKQIGAALNRDEKSICNRRTRLGIESPRTKPKLTQKHREAYVAQLDDQERKKFFEKEIIASSRYKSIKGALSTEEQRYYVEKYVEFMMDPTIETMTAMEKDTLHQMLVAEIQTQRYLAEEKAHKDLILKLINGGQITDPGKIPAFSRSREIKDAQDVIMKCQSSLMVERKQRLKDQSDQSVTFTNLIKELKDPRNRFRLGAEAAMLKVIAEQTYNSRIDKNIFSGSGKKFDVSRNFRNGEAPDLPDDFLPSVDGEKDAVQEQDSKQEVDPGLADSEPGQNE